MDKEFSLHTDFKWFSWFSNPMAVLYKNADHQQTAAEIVQLS